ncbi:MAG: hypothetical protein WHX53_10300, partial [Anaerolineae bacterium]
LVVLAGRGAVFFPANYGREGLHMWIVAAMFRLMGVTPLALRLPSVIAGIATALATYWLGHELLRAANLSGRAGGRPRIKPEYTNDARRDSCIRKDMRGRQLAISRADAHAAAGATADGNVRSVGGQRSAVAIFRTGWTAFLPLLAALYVATSYWHVHFSRFGIRGVFTPLFGALAFAAFWRGVNGEMANGERANRRMGERAKGRMGEWANGRMGESAMGRSAFGMFRPALCSFFALAGLFLGLSLHFYTASRFFPFFLIGFLAVEWLVAWATGRSREAILVRHFWGIAVMFVVAALVFAPLAIYFLQHPGSFTQRAAEVAAIRAADPLARMVQAALANVAQFFVPGAGDPEQFYNLPRRAVFDLPTAVLALLGIAAVLWRWRTPAALFLLTWFPALLLPSFLATDRWPTLPRVLGVIPGVYFFPAIGLIVLLSAIAVRAPQLRLPSRHPVALSPYYFVVFSALALIFHAGATYRDYFRVWGPSQATFDAFEGDMAAAWQWLRNNRAEGHVYLSSDIYRHPTFMLLHERATVQTIFTHRNEHLSWFDARGALPLPPTGQSAVYLIGSSAPFNPRVAGLLSPVAHVRERVPAPDGSAALTVIALPAGTDLVSRAVDVFPQGIRFTDRLTLLGARFAPHQDGVNWLTLAWRADGPDPQAWSAYRLEVAGRRPDGAAWQDDLPFDAFRPPEWTPGGLFLTWHKLDVPGGEPLSGVRLRLLRTEDAQPVVRPDAPDGWRAVPGG